MLENPALQKYVMGKGLSIFFDSLDNTGLSESLVQNPENDTCPNFVFMGWLPWKLINSSWLPNNVFTDCHYINTHPTIFTQLYLLNLTFYSIWWSNLCRFQYMSQKVPCTHYEKSHLHLLKTDLRYEMKQIFALKCFLPTAQV